VLTHLHFESCWGVAAEAPGKGSIDTVISNAGSLPGQRALASAKRHTRAIWLIYSRAVNCWRAAGDLS